MSPWLLAGGVLAVVVWAATRSSQPKPSSEPFQRGRASWYGASYQGRQTASGEPFDRHKFTAAHRTLKHGTVLHVTDVATGATTVVRVNDRGPYVDGRILDLSEAAAVELDMIERGVVDVEIRVVG